MPKASCKNSNYSSLPILDNLRTRSIGIAVFLLHKRVSNLRTLKWYRAAPVARISPEEANWTNEPRKQPTNYTHRDKRLFVSMSQQKASLNCQVLLLVTFLTKPLYSISKKKHSYLNHVIFLNIDCRQSKISSCEQMKKKTEVAWKKNLWIELTVQINHNRVQSNVVPSSTCQLNKLTNTQYFRFRCGSPWI